MPVSERQSSGWDVRNAPKNYLWLVTAQGGSAILAFASVWLITRTLGSEGYGGVVAVIAASQIVQVLVNWTGTAVIRFGVDEFIETGLIARTFWLRLITLTLNFALVLSLSRFWFPPLADWLKLSPDIFWLLVLHFVATAMWLHFQFSLQGAKMPRQQATLLLIERASIFASLATLLLINKLDNFSAILCYAAAPVLMVFTSLFLLRKLVFVRLSLDWKFYRKILAYSLPLLPHSLVGYLSSGYVDAIFISNFLSIRDLGVYSIAVQINGMVLQLPTLANLLLLPLFVTLQKESQNTPAYGYLQNILPGLTLFWGLACMVLGFAGYFAIPLIFGVEFQGAVSPLWILLAASAVSLPALMGYYPLSNSLSTTYITMYGAISAAAANIIANFLLIPAFGLAGCAWATVIAYFVSVIVPVLLLRRRANIPISWVFIAMTPAISGGLSLSLTGNAWWALAISLGSGFLVAYLYKNSVKQTIVFILNFAGRKKFQEL